MALIAFVAVELLLQGIYDHILMHDGFSLLLEVCLHDYVLFNQQLFLSEDFLIETLIISVCACLSD